MGQDGRMGTTMAKQYWIGDVRSGSHDGEKVELKGWVHRTRGSNKIRFIVLRDSTGHVQCVAKRDSVGDECFESLTVEDVKDQHSINFTFDTGSNLRLILDLCVRLQQL